MHSKSWWWTQYIGLGDDVSILFIGPCAIYAHCIKLCIDNNIPFLAVDINIKHHRDDRIMLRRNHKAKEMMSERNFAQLYVHIVDPFVVENLEAFDYWLNSHKFIPDTVFCHSEALNALHLEKHLNEKFKCKSYIDDRAVDFFASKREQDRVCRGLGIPVPNKTGDKIIVKRDYRNTWSEPLVIPKIRLRDSTYEATEGEFTQEWIDIQYIYNCSVYIDSFGDWYLVFNNRLVCEYSIPYAGENPYFPTPNILQQLIDIISPLQKAISVKKRFLMIQIMQPRNSNKLLYMETNCRPSTEFNWVRNESRSTFDPYSHMVFEKSLPNAFQFDKVLHTDLVFNSVKHKMNNSLLSSAEIWDDWGNNWSGKEETILDGAYIPIKL